MTYTLHTIKPDGTVASNTQPAAPSLEAMQEVVGGDLEQVHRFFKYDNNRCIAYVNENGRALNLSFNALATAMWLEQDELGAQPLVGNVLVIVAAQDLLDKM